MLNFEPLTLSKQVDVTVSQQQVKGLQVSLHMTCTHSHHLRTQDTVTSTFTICLKKFCSTAMGSDI